MAHSRETSCHVKTYAFLQLEIEIENIQGRPFLNAKSFELKIWYIIKYSLSEHYIFFVNSFENIYKESSPAELPKELFLHNVCLYELSYFFIHIIRFENLGP